MTPFEFGIVLHYYTSCAAHPSLGCPIWDETVRSLSVSGLIGVILERGDKEIIVTDKGKAWIEHAINTPLPEMKWIIPERSA